MLLGRFTELVFKMILVMFRIWLFKTLSGNRFKILFSQKRSPATTLPLQKRLSHAMTKTNARKGCLTMYFRFFSYHYLIQCKKYLFLLPFSFLFLHRSKICICSYTFLATTTRTYFYKSQKSF